MDLETFQRQYGYEQSCTLENLPENSKTCNLDRNLAAEKAEAEQKGVKLLSVAPSVQVAQVASTAQAPLADVVSEARVPGENR